MSCDFITILGPTACGKTRVATHLAQRVGGEIISADSRMMYRGMTIGTGKDLGEYVVNGQPIPYHNIDVRDAGERYSVYEFQRSFEEAYSQIKRNGAVPIMCGGTGLYIESVLRRYRLGEVRIPDRQSLTIGLSVSRDLRRQKITRRLGERLAEGMVDEVRHLLTYVPAERLISYGLEYKYLTLYLTGVVAYDEMVRRLETAIHQFAKRQMTWFRGMEERRGVPIKWIDACAPVEQICDEIEALM